MSLLALMLMPLTLSLGIWQLHRGEEKRALLEQLAMPTQHITSVRQLPDAGERTRALLYGGFLPGRDLLLDNQPRAGTPGLAVVSPFALQNGGLVLVVRGWLPATGYRRDFAAALPPLADSSRQSPDGLPVELSPPPPSLLTSSEPSAGWPKTVVRLNIADVSGWMRQPLAPLVGWSLQPVGGLPLPQRPSSGFKPARHFGYAVQWFALSAIVLLGYLWFGFAAGRRTGRPESVARP